MQVKKRTQKSGDVIFVDAMKRVKLTGGSVSAPMDSSKPSLKRKPIPPMPTVTKVKRVYEGEAKVVDMDKIPELSLKFINQVVEEAIEYLKAVGDDDTLYVFDYGQKAGTCERCLEQRDEIFGDGSDMETWDARLEEMHDYHGLEHTGGYELFHDTEAFSCFDLDW